MMQLTRIPFQKAGWLSPLVVDYLAGAESLSALAAFPPGAAGLDEALQERRNMPVDRAALVEALQRQYARLPENLPGDSEKVKSQIEALRDENTFTVTTGHQLNLFTGPLYTVYKLFSAIRQADYLASRHPDCRFVPVYWMASEDHDIAEINHVHLFGKRIEWPAPEGGPAGHLEVKSFGPVLDRVAEMMGDRETARTLDTYFRSAYRDGIALAQATRALVHVLTSRFGMVVIDGDDPVLKKGFLDIMRDDLLQQTAHDGVGDAVEKLKAAGYKEQVHARGINLFYIGDGRRERIEAAEGRYRTTPSHTEITEAMLTERPGDFSPNVVLRPVYQERTLPNVSYVGGPAEISYWLELKSVFRHYQVFFPYLSLRNMAMWIDATTGTRLRALGFSAADVLRDEDDLIAAYVKRHAGAPLSLDDEAGMIENAYDGIAAKAGDRDASLHKAIEGERQKALNQIRNLEGKMLRAEKKRHDTEVGQIRKLKARLFPGGSYQERQEGFMAPFLAHGEAFLDFLARELEPLPEHLLILSEAEGQ